LSPVRVVTIGVFFSKNTSPNWHMFPSGKSRLGIAVTNTLGARFDLNHTAAVVSMSTAPTALRDLKLPAVGNEASENGAEGRSGGIVSDTLATGVMFALGLTVLQRLLGFVRGILFCRWMTPEELGQFSLLSGGLMMLAPLAVLGLPGTFGRFVEHYTQAGQLHAYLARIGRVSLVMTLGLASLMVLLPEFFGWLLLGETEHPHLIWLTAGCLLAVAWCNYLTSLVEALRQVRLASLMRFVISTTFLIGGLGLLWGLTARTEPALFAFGLSSLLGALPAWWYLRQRSSVIKASSRPLPGRELWLRVLPFAAWWWFSNLLHNSYELADRYLLIWFSKLGVAEVQAAVGQLHSAKVLPVLVVNVAGMLSGMLLPFLSAALVRGEPEQASKQLNWTLKLAAVALVGINHLILCTAPWLFGQLLQGRYAEGLELLPLATAGCSWMCLMTVSQDWLWARERGKLAVLALGCGLVVTLVIGGLSIPTHGAWGSLLATLFGSLTSLGLVAWFNEQTGCHHDRGVWIGFLLPLLALVGPGLGACGVVLVVYLALQTNWYFSGPERQQLAEKMTAQLQRFRPNSAQ
jgi:O-antigen/teichoic acid export membrane protein